MKVQEIILEGYRRRYILLDDDGIPIVSVVRYLKHLDNIAKGSTTLKSYCYDFKVVLLLAILSRCFKYLTTETIGIPSSSSKIYLRL
ncbi:hypothetical protein [Vallitalea sediminicola]